MSMPPAISTTSETHPIAEINAWSHPSKNTLGRFGKVPARLRASATRSDEDPNSDEAWFSALPHLYKHTHFVGRYSGRITRRLSGRAVRPTSRRRLGDREPHCLGGGVGQRAVVAPDCAIPAAQDQGIPAFVEHRGVDRVRCAGVAVVGKRDVDPAGRRDGGGGHMSSGLDIEAPPP